jgi:integrase
MGVNVKVIQELLGHSDISITLRTYSHLLPSMQQELVQTSDGMFGEDDENSKKQGAKSMIPVLLSFFCFCSLVLLD